MKVRAVQGRMSIELLQYNWYCLEYYWYYYYYFRGLEESGSKHAEVKNVRSNLW